MSEQLKDNSIAKKLTSVTIGSVKHGSFDDTNRGQHNDVSFVELPVSIQDEFSDAMKSFHGV